jgi:hypothetical protein
MNTPGIRPALAGAMTHPFEDGRPVGREGIVALIEMCRRPYDAVGPGAGCVDQFVR